MAKSDSIGKDPVVYDQTSNAYESIKKQGNKSAIAKNMLEAVEKLKKKTGNQDSISSIGAQNYSAILQQAAAWFGAGQGAASPGQQGGQENKKKKEEGEELSEEDQFFNCELLLNTPDENLTEEELERKEFCAFLQQRIELEIREEGAIEGFEDFTPDANLAFNNPQSGLSQTLVAFAEDIDTLLTTAQDATFDSLVCNTLDAALDVQFSNTLLVVGNVVFSNTLYVVGNTEMSNTLYVVGNTSLGNTLYVRGKTDIEITGDDAFKDALCITGSGRVTPTDWDRLAIDFQLENANSEKTSVAKLAVAIADVTEGTEDGAFYMYISNNGGAPNQTWYFDSHSLLPLKDQYLGSATWPLNHVYVGNSSVNSTFGIPTSGQWTGGDYFLNANGSWTQPLGGGDSDNQRTVAIGFIIDGGGGTIQTGNKYGFRVPFGGTIKACSMGLDQTGSIVVDIWKDTHANYPPTDADSITASAVPTISSGIKDEDTTLTGWTTAITAGDWLYFNVDSVTSATYCAITLEVEKT